MTSGRCIAALWLLMSVAAARVAADDAIRERARAAVSKSDVQSNLEFGDISEIEWLKKLDRSRPVVNSGPANVDALGSMLLYTGIAVAVILLLLTIYRLAVDRPVTALAGARGLSATGSADAADQTSDQWLGDADELARQGRWDEAIHTLLLSAIRTLSDEFGRPKASRTSRELVQQFRLDERRLAAFRQLVAAVEQAIFGGRSPSEEDYAACRNDAATIRGIAS